MSAASSEASAGSSPKGSSAIPSLFRSASLIAVITIISKILGLVRDQMIAHSYGASLVSDAYLYAFQIPSFCLVLLGGMGGPFHTTTVAVLSKLTHPEEATPNEKAQRVTNTFITTTALFFGALSLLAFLFAPQCIDLLASHASPELKAIAAVQLRWMSPIILMGALVGILCGVSNAYHRFLWPALAPSGINVTLILWLLIRGADAMGDALAISTLLGAMLQLAMQLPEFFRLGFRYFPCFDVRDENVKTLGELLFPATIGTTIGQLNIFVAMFFISQLEPGGWTATVLGNRLIQLPLGVLTIAMLVPLFPRLTRLVADGDLETMKASFREGILSLWLISFPIVALILLLGEPSVRVLFERGAFNHRDTLLVTSVLVVLSFSILPYMLRDGMTRIFYAFNDSKTPLYVGLSSIGINAILNAVLVGPFGIQGIAFSTVVVTLCNATLLSILVRRHIPSMELSKLIKPSLKMLTATLIIWGIGYGFLSGLRSVSPSWHLSPFLDAIIEILALTALVFPLYIGLLMLLKEDLAQRLLARLKLIRH